uniref:Uncharacterized protein n=1 Tax=Lactuca sativa TaxID=4236 RepID=A0A9R1WEB6_LACSA|nr:hypothetical protein LSAT_V11C200073000 [Lactuca sativa]
MVQVSEARGASRREEAKRGWSEARSEVKARSESRFGPKARSDEESDAKVGVRSEWVDIPFLVVDSLELQEPSTNNVDASSGITNHQKHLGKLEKIVIRLEIGPLLFTHTLVPFHVPKTSLYSAGDEAIGDGDGEVHGAEDEVVGDGDKESHGAGDVDDVDGPEGVLMDLKVVLRNWVMIREIRVTMKDMRLSHWLGE